MSSTTTTAPKTTEKAVTVKKKADPQLEAPAPTIKTPRTGRFVYVPGTGTFAGSTTEWFKNDPDSQEWNALRKCPRLGGFLTTNPMAIVYANIADDLTLRITQISMGGSFLPNTTARAILPFLPWYGDAEKAATKTVVDPDEEGKTLPQKRELRAAKADKVAA